MRVIGLVLILGCSACTCGTSLPADDGGTFDAGSNADGGDAGTSPDSGWPTDAGLPDSGDTTDAGAMDGGSGACPGVGDPAACDDGTGSLGSKTACALTTVPGSTESFHLRVTGSALAPIGACLYVTPTTCAQAHADVLEFSGGQGTGPGSTFGAIGPHAPYCFRLVSAAWDSNWADDGMSGNVLAASLRPKAVIQWIHTYLRTSGTTPLCATGGSAGSSELLYQLMHNDGEALLDHVQLVSATPYARFDEGCDPTTPAEGTDVVCSGLPAGTKPQYDYLEGASNPGAVRLVSGETHDLNCDDAGVQTSGEAATLRAMSLVTSGFAPLTLAQTSLSVYMCTSVPNATQGQAVYVFGVNADLASADAGPYTGLISLSLATSFYGCAAGATCVPHIVCDPACNTESYASTPANQVALATDMQDNCVVRH
jgi:hypothetical protein